MPVFVAGDGAGDEEIAAVADVGEQGLPGGLAEGLRGRKNDEFGRAEFGDLIFGDDVARLMEIVAERADGVLLRGDLQIGLHGVLRGLRSDDSDDGLLGIDEIGRSGGGEFGHVAEHRGFRLFGAVGVESADGSFIAFRHVGIGIPEPLDGAGTADKRHARICVRRA